MQNIKTQFTSDNVKLPSLIYWDIYYFDNLDGKPAESFSFGVWDGTIVRGPWNKLTWKGQPAKKAFQYFKNKNYIITKT